MAPGCSSSIPFAKKNHLSEPYLYAYVRKKHNLPTVPTVSIEPDSNTCLSTASANSAAASPASFLIQAIHSTINLLV